jgi:MFS family permease
MSSLIIPSPLSASPPAVSPAVATPWRRVTVLRRDLRASLGDGVGHGGMVGLGETYFPAFALAVGLGELMAGLVASLPLLAGGLMQMISPWGIRRIGSHKRWVICCSTIQVLVFLPLMLTAWWGHVHGAVLLALAGMYWATGLSTGPAWNTWIGTLVPRGVRANFFALRTRLAQAAVLCGFLLGGLTLHAASATPHLLTAFALLFALAGLCRLVSVVMLARQSEPVLVARRMQLLPWHDLRHRLGACSGGQLLVYLVVVQAAVQMSGPFFAPFMLEQLQFSYGAYVALISTAYLAKVLALPAWGRLARGLGAQRLLWIGGLGIIPLSAGWIVSQHLVWLLALQVLSGVAWGAYELAFFLLFFESIAEDERTSLLTFYNLLNTVAWVAGALVGSAILFGCGTSFYGYLLVFGLSSVGRVLALPLLARVAPREVSVTHVSVGPVSIRPNSTALNAPILASLPDTVSESWCQTAS